MQVRYLCTDYVRISIISFFIYTEFLVDRTVRKVINNNTDKFEIRKFIGNIRILNENICVL